MTSAGSPFVPTSLEELQLRRVHQALPSRPGPPHPEEGGSGGVDELTTTRLQRFTNGAFEVQLHHRGRALVRFPPSTSSSRDVGDPQVANEERLRNEKLQD